MEPRPEDEFPSIPEESQRGEILPGMEDGLGRLEERRGVCSFAAQGIQGWRSGKDSSMAACSAGASAGVGARKSRRAVSRGRGRTGWGLMTVGKAGCLTPPQPAT